VSHANTVTIYDAGADHGRLYLVMELVPGTTLATHLREHGPLDIREATDITDQILAGLTAAHARGIVHRDLKPANVMLRDDGTVKLTDFGIAKVLTALAGDLTTTGLIIGTPKYVAPEVAGGQPATARSDLYAVGVMLYEMLAGAPPFTATTPAAMLAAHQQ